ncbi:hypothetical protein CDAR_399441 [Caerostris darwini]|uniref:Uncharacterized protein n=1 Tax=Caerostris darwini TaxID=1538125 RepID=A0AAV4T1D2_9ARAC|nr:hypothetical protein CDAR_399441 [Caerostris darwini]
MITKRVIEKGEISGSTQLIKQVVEYFLVNTGTTNLNRNPMVSSEKANFSIIGATSFDLLQQQQQKQQQQRCATRCESDIATYKTLSAFTRVINSNNRKCVKKKTKSFFKFSGQISCAKGAIVTREQ